jgi:DNA-binding HxlR family transcriptional regulator
MHAALELLGRRWALRVVWELRAGTPLTYGELRARCDGMSTSVLRDRLVELVDAGLVTQGDDGAYALSRLGASLAANLQPLEQWARRWRRAADR